MQRFCEECREPMGPKYPNKRFCSRLCGEQNYRRSHPYIGKNYQPRICEKCSGEYKPVYKTQKYCSRLCKQKVSTEFYRIPRKSKLPTGTVGAIAEIVVAADLLESGYEVFRAISPHCSCDLAIIKGDKLLRVEVRTGYLNRKGKIRYTVPTGKHDILAVNTQQGVFYIPEDF